MQRRPIKKAITVTIKKTFCKKFKGPLDFDFYKRLKYLYGLKEELTVRHKLNSSKTLFCVVEIPQQHTSFQTVS